METREDKPNFQVPNLERGLQVLEFMIGLEGGISLNRLAKTLDFPVNSLARIMHALEYYGYVDREASTKEYALSHKMLSMGASRSHAKSLLESSLDIMRSLRDEFGETVVISIISDGHGLILEQVQGTHPFRFVCDPGTKQALHCSASCKAILAFTPAARRAPIVNEIKFQKMTEATITTKQRYREELADVMEKGYALDRAEAIDGVHCVAAPVLDPHGNALAAITMTGPSSRVPLEDMAAIGRTLSDNTLVISRRLGHLA